MKAYPLSWPRESNKNLGVENWFLPCICPIIRPFWNIIIYNLLKFANSLLDYIYIYIYIYIYCFFIHTFIVSYVINCVWWYIYIYIHIYMINMHMHTVAKTCGRSGVAVLVWTFWCGRFGCGRSGLWPLWLAIINSICFQMLCYSRCIRYVCFGINGPITAQLSNGPWQRGGIAWSHLLLSFTSPYINWPITEDENRLYLNLHDISMFVYVVICAAFTYTYMYIINPYVGVGHVWTNHNAYWP